MLTKQAAAHNTANSHQPWHTAAGRLGLVAHTPSERRATWPGLSRLSRLDRQALVRHGVAEAAAWEGFLAGMPMTWLEVQA